MTGDDFPPLPRSAVRGIRWPAPPPPLGALALALQYQLGQSEWFSPQRLIDLQLLQIRELLRHAHAHSRYYRSRIDQAGIDPAAPLTLEAFRRLPLSSRTDVQSHAAELTSDQTPRDHGSLRKARTSGSTGRPIEYLTNDLCQLFWQAITLREHLWHRRDFMGKLAVIRAHAPNTENRGWGPATDMAFQTGPCVTLDIRTDVESQAAWLEAQDPDYLLSYPSNLAELARSYQAGRFRLTRLRELRTLGETLDPSTRALCQEVFQVPVTDMYSASETGYLALQCPEYPHYHVQSETVLVEILDERGQPCAPGSVGQVVVTALHNFSMPLIRYAIGDYAEVGEPCPCGRGLPVIKRILGRARNMLTLPDGRRLWPVLDYRLFAEVLPVEQLRMIQKAPDRIEVELVTPLRPDHETERRLAEAVCRSLGHAFHIEFRYLDRIPRSEGGKFEDFVSEVTSFPESGAGT